MDTKKKEIIKETAKLYFKYGIRSVTMDDIAQELSMSKKTLYQYFTDKTSLVDSVVEYFGTKTDLSHCGEGEGLNAIEKHHYMYKKISSLILNTNESFEYDMHKYYPVQFKKMIKYRRNTMFDKMKLDLKQGIDEGFFRSDINIEKVVILNMMRIESMKDNEILEKYNYKLIDVLDEFFKYHLYAIATEKGINEYKRILRESND